MDRVVKCMLLPLLLAVSCEPEVAVAKVQEVAAAAVTPSLSDQAKEVASPQVDEEAIAQPNNDCWWYRPGDRELVAVWVSPRLPGQVPGGFRFVNLFFHGAGVRPGLLLHSSPVESKKRHEVAVKNGGRHLRVEPVAGKTWSEVVDRKDLKVLFDGV